MRQSSNVLYKKMFIKYTKKLMTPQDIRELIRYWLKGSDYDWKTAGDLLRSKKYPYCLFMCHLSLEKLLKALVVKETKSHPPYTHNLAYLAGKLPLEFSKEKIVLLEEMNDFNLEARYPDEQMAFYKKATRAYALHYKKLAGELREWLRKKL